MENSKNNIASLFRKFGFLFPSSPSEVEMFEKNHEPYSEEIKNIENPISILEKGKCKLEESNIKTFQVSDFEVDNLAMAAREGKEITEAVRNQMNKDRKNAE